jgi:hypothetical protein
MQSSEPGFLAVSRDPLSVWHSGALLMTNNGQPVNPLAWWMQQQCAGNIHGGLLQMALDFLSCPGVSFKVKIFGLLAILTISD